MSNPIIVGGGGCSISRVITTLQKSPSFGEFHEKWSDLARELETPNEKIKKLRNDQLVNKLTLSDVLHEMVEEWVARQGKGASLQKLITAIEQIGMVACADALRNEFGQPSQLRGSLKGTLPHRLAYYINRTLVTRNIISKKIFDRKSSDILLFTGMERYELSGLVKGTTFSSSEELLSGAKINQGSTGILNQPHHFGKICEKTDHPVHWLHRESDGRLRWKRSSGGIATLQGYIDEAQDQIKEEALPMKLSPKVNLPICISDSPGMGKSVLLSEIGRKLHELCPDRTVVFVEAREFLQLVKKSKAKDTISAVKEVFIHLDVGMANPEQTAKVSTIGFELSVELLLDGFDELDGTDTELAYSILQTIKLSFQQIRIWVTSRPHFLNELENKLDTLGYTIQPFSKDDQANFLTSFWSGMGTDLDQQKLMQFALKCLDNLKQVMSSDELDIAGIPLQCLLIGEVFADGAVDYAKDDKSTYSFGEIGIESITSLYQLLVSTKILKYQILLGVDDRKQSSRGNLLQRFSKKILRRKVVHSRRARLSEEEIMNMHAKLSLVVLFPLEYPKLKTWFVPVQIDEILRCGLLETVKKRRVGFVHRTFAEYFVSWFLLDRLSSKANWNKLLSEFLFGYVLQCQPFIDQVYLLGRITTCQFQNHVTTYFLNAQIVGDHIQQHEPLNLLQEGEFGEFQESIIRQLAHACVRGDLLHLFNFFLRMNLFSGYEKNIFDRSFILYTIAQSRFLVKPCFTLFSKHHEFDLNMQSEALRVAVYYGRFSTLEFLVKEKGLFEIVEKLRSDTKWLLHDCLIHSNRNTERQIENKIQIIRSLVELNPALLEVDDAKENTPLLAVETGANVHLLIELLKLGSYIFARDNAHDTVLHKIVHLESASECHIFIASIPFENLKKLIFMKNEKGNMPLFKLVEKHDLPLETLKIFQDAGFDFGTQQENGYSLLDVAVIHMRNANTIRQLIHLGCDTSWRGEDGMTLLHIAVSSGNLEATQVFLESGRIDIHSMDGHGMSPMDYLLKGTVRSFKGNVFEIGCAIHERGGRFGQRFMPEFHARLRYCGTQRKLELLRLLIYLRLVDLNEADENGNTLAHILVDRTYSSISEVSYYEIIDLLKRNGASLTAVNKQGETVYHVALRNEWMGVGDVCQLDHKNYHLRTPDEFALFLKCVIRDGNNLDEEYYQPLVDLCLDSGAADVTNIFTDKEGKSMMHLAVKNEDVKTVQMLLKVKGSGIHTKTNRHYTTLHYAAFARNKDVGLTIIQCLIDNGVDIYARDNSGFTFLHLFITFSKPSPIQFYKLVKCLLSRYSHVSVSKLFNMKCGGNSTTPLLEAALKLEIYQGTLLLLHSIGVNFNILDRDGNNIITYAVWGGRSSKIILTLSILTQIGHLTVDLALLHKYDSLTQPSLDYFDLTIKDAFANSLFLAAVNNEDEWFARILLNKMAGTLRQWQYTPLHYAALAMNKKFAIEIINIFIANGVDVYAKDHGNRTFLHLLITSSKPSPKELHSITKILVDANASKLFNIPGGRDETTPLHEAVLNTEMEEETLTLLIQHGVDFHVVDSDGNSVWTYAVWGRRSEKFMQFLANIPGLKPESVDDSFNELQI